MFALQEVSGTDEQQPTAQCTECTSGVFDFPIQDESTNLLSFGKRVVVVL